MTTYIRPYSKDLKYLQTNYHLLKNKEPPTRTKLVETSANSIDPRTISNPKSVA